MSKNKTTYICSECGYESASLWGRCPSCKSWGSMEEKNIKPTPHFSSSFATGNVDITSINDVDESNGVRFSTGMKELDRVLGGGLVMGSLVLVGGDPGIGKSTLLLQICRHLGMDKTVFYVSGEESKGQIKIRANRLDVHTENVKLISETNIENIAAAALEHQPDILIIDSIQTMFSEQVNSTPGSAVQIRECTAVLMRLAKENNITVFVIGHVTKEGSLAGPKILEHMVDTVLYFEGDKNLTYRILRAVKNRFGSTNEIGVFDMVGQGLIEVDNPSKMFLDGRPKNVPGTCVTCIIEGTRPLLAEIQALVTKTNFAVPRRMASGLDYNRASLLIAVLEKKANYQLFNQDAYINVVGGFRVEETSADLAVALAIASSLADFEMPSDLLAIGEIGLSGEIRAVSFIEKRISEAQKLGFKKIMIPSRNKITGSYDDIELIKVSSLAQAIYLIRNQDKAVQ